MEHRPFSQRLFIKIPRNSRLAPTEDVPDLLLRQTHGT
ncbi:hypothetical protein D779_1774 [Imhoffiella purpurea]|uniref:Uncharacterized protein n=1 Tax=Imhoffiella purpurea TaxID=1249627 RepID=W9VIX6_9GAMM|nr:hypothetical protein D779_1774 [Imhoffiella purpurea]